MSALGPISRVILLLGTWLVWALGLLALRGHRLQKPVQVDSKARWGLVLEMAGYVVVCTHGGEFWNSDLELWRAITGLILALFSTVIFGSAVANLGRQWRFDAGLNKDHELVQTGAYRIVRHPIYASMLGMLLADVCFAGTLPGWPIAVILFVAGTEIRIRVEDGLLRERFGESFIEWQRARPAYLPFLR